MWESDIFTTSDRPYGDATENKKEYKGKVSDLVLPIVSLIVCCVIGMIYTGGFFRGVPFVDAFSGCSADVGLALGSGAALIITIVWYLVRRVLKFKDCMAGAVCGDHCSPISDTTIMASAGGQCNHVSTQLPYEITVAAVSFVTYIVAGFVKGAWIALPIGTVLMLAVLLVLGKRIDKE